MRTTPPTRRLLAGCAAVAVLVETSCTQDPNDNTLAGPPEMAVAAVSAYDIVQVPSTRFTIDGNLSDWGSIPTLSMADDPANGRGSLNNSATVKLAWDATYLYAAYNVTDTELLKIQTTRDDPNLYKDDAVELYVDPQGNGAADSSMTTTDYKFLTTVAGVLGDNRGTGSGGQDASYNAASFVTGAVANGTINGGATDTGYSIEMKVSWSDLGVTPAIGNFMRIDPAVDDRDGAATTTEEFDWAGLTSFNNPSGWKDVKLVGPQVTSAYNIVKVPAGGVTLDGDLSDWAGVAGIAMADDPGNGRGAANNSANVKLAWDPTYLYFAYDVTDTELLAIQTARDASALYKDDAIELYIDPQGDGSGASFMTTTDYKLISSVQEVLGDTKGTGTSSTQDASYNAASFLAQAVAHGTVNGGGTDTGYSLEAKVAWSDLGVTPADGKFMRIDPAVDDRDGAATTTEEFDWAGLTSFNNPNGWKDVQLVVDASAPAAPTNLALTVVSSSQINVSWTASSSTDAAKYKIYRGTTGTPTLLTTVAGSPYQNTGLTAGTTYTYQISALDAAGNESAKTAAKSATTTAGGLKFAVGPWHAPTELVGATARWSGLQHNGDAPSLKRMLDSLRASQARVVLSTLRSRMKDANGDLSTSAFATEIGKWDAAVDLGPYFADGTLIAINVMDDITSGWTTTVTSAQIDSLARITKQTWPNAKVSTRTKPTDLPSYNFAYLDIAWAQYRGPYRDGTPASYRDTQVNAAKAKGLGLVLSLNTLDGGCGASTGACLSGIPGTNILGTYENAASVRRYQMSAAELLEYGKVFIAEPYNCSLLPWRYSVTYDRASYMTDAQYNGIVNFDQRSDVISSWQQLVALGKNRSAGQCGRYTP